MPKHTQPCTHYTLALGLKHQTTHSAHYEEPPVQCILLPQPPPNLLEVAEICSEICLPKTDLPEMR